MQELDLMVKNLTTLFSINPDFQDIRFITAFTAADKASPLNRPTVAFSVKQMEEKDVTPVYTKVDEEAGEIPELLYNHTTFVRLRVDIHVPQTTDGVVCYEIYQRLSRVIMDNTFNIPFVGVGCEELRYDRDMGAFTLYTYMDLYEETVV